MSPKSCEFVKKDGERCRAAPIHGASLCFRHHPDYAIAAVDASRLGGSRHKRELRIEAVYAVNGLASVLDIRRVLEVAVIDALALENSLARSRVLIFATVAAAKLLEVGELEARLKTIEAALGPRLAGGSAPDPGESWR